jgi:glycosyltransferase involved in cell wall biosynthesis
MDIVKQKRIGFLFLSNDIGAIYYLLNIIKSFNYLQSKIKRPFIRIYYIDECYTHLEGIDYPNIEFIRIPKYNYIISYLKSLIFQQNLFIKMLPQIEDLDALFPFNNFPVTSNSGNIKLVSWIPDFQHKFYPKYFTKINYLLRELRFRLILKKSNYLVLSSYDAKKHLDRFYQTSKKLKIFILQFSSMIKDNKITNYEVVRKKYNISKTYFLVSNQFYEHKNHLVVLKAVKILKKQNLNYQIVFTGKTDDYRNPEFSKSIFNFIDSNNLSPYVRILGLIPREDQLSLLKNCVAVVQPSKFEGWSTIIEDGKSLSKKIIASSIGVHIEQLENKADFFDPDSEIQLSSILLEYIKCKKLIDSDDFNYDERAIAFASNFIKILE